MHQLHARCGKKQFLILFIDISEPGKCGETPITSFAADFHGIPRMAATRPDRVPRGISLAT